MRGKIVGIDPLQLGELLHCLVVLMLLIVGDAQLPASIARVWILPHDLEQVGDLGVGMSGPPLQQRRVIESPRILWAEGQSLVYARAGRSILFPLDLSQRDIGIGVGI